MATLAQKLQIKPGQSLILRFTPEAIDASLRALLDGIVLLDASAPKADSALIFVTQLAAVAERMAAGIALIAPSDLLWVAYPKGGSKIPTDLNRDRIPPVAPLGWRPVRQIAIDSDWSALRFRPAEAVGR